MELVLLLKALNKEGISCSAHAGMLKKKSRVEVVRLLWMHSSKNKVARRDGGNYVVHIIYLFISM
jgi:hypothetical protein